jgi:assimilatory nitrate reductase catalytic subunit
VLFRAAAHEPPPDEVLRRLEALFAPAGAETLRYADQRKGQRRSVRVRREGADMKLDGLLLAGDTSAEAWLKALLLQDLPAQAYGGCCSRRAPRRRWPCSKRASRCAAASAWQAPAIEGFLAGLRRLARKNGWARCRAACAAAPTAGPACRTQAHGPRDRAAAAGGLTGRAHPPR